MVRFQNYPSRLGWKNDQEEQRLRRILILERLTEPFHIIANEIDRMKAT